MCIKGIHNTVADAISRLDYNPDVNVMNNHSSSYERFVYHMVQYNTETNWEARESDATISNGTTFSQSSDMYSTLMRSDARLLEEDACFARACAEYEENIQSAFANSVQDESEIYPVTVLKIAQAQRKDKAYKAYFKRVTDADKDSLDSRFTVKVIDDEQVLVFEDKRLVIPSKKMQSRIIQWYHHYLQHPGQNRLEETLCAVMYWRGMRAQVRQHVKTCDRCQKGKPKQRRKYGHLPPKIAEVTPWKSVCVDLIGPYTIKGKDGTILDFMCLTMIDPATGWFEIIELPTASVEIVRKGEEITDVILDKSSAQVSRLFNMTWLSRYPRAKYIIFDNGSEFKLHFRELCESYALKAKTTSVKNPQANSILERIHGVIKDMIRTTGLDMSPTVTPDDIANILVDVAWAVRSTYHTVLETSPGAAIFGRDMLFDIPYIADWSDIGKRRQLLVDQKNAKENSNRIDFDYAVGQKVLLKKDGIIRKLEDRYDGPFTITQVHTNGTVRIQRGTVNERINIRRLAPYFEKD